MLKIFRCITAFILLSAFFVVSGCNDSVDTTTVSGKVTYRAEPLANGSATFYPQVGRPVSVGIDASGAYSVQLLSGEYRVAIHGPGIQVPEGWKEGDPESPPPKIVLPPEYSQRTKTTLRVMVSEGAEPQTEDFDLK